MAYDVNPENLTNLNILSSGQFNSPLVLCVSKNIFRGLDIIILYFFIKCRPRNL